MVKLGIFTTIKVINSVPLFFDKHKTRIISHAKQLGISVPNFSVETIENYLKENNVESCALKITIKNNLVIEHRHLPETKPLKVISFDDTRNTLRVLKTTDRLVNNNAKKIAEDNNADDALFVQDNFIIESTYANIFAITSDGKIITPPLDGKGLKGIARAVIMENLKVQESPIPKDTRMKLVLTNSLRVQQITHLNGNALPDSKELAEMLKGILENAV